MFFAFKYSKILSLDFVNAVANEMKTINIKVLFFKNCYDNQKNCYRTVTISVN